MNATDILKYGHLTLLHAIEGLPQSSWKTGGVCGAWSVTDVIGHLAAYEHVLEEVLNSFLGGGDTPYMTEFSKGTGFNDSQAALRQGHTAQEALTEYQETHDRVTILVPQIKPDIWRKTGTIPWYGSEYSLDDFIVYAFYGHKREHSAQIAVFRDSLKIQ